MSTPSKSDTRVMLASGDVETDVSQWAVDLTGVASGSYEENSARTAIDGDGYGRTLEVSFDADSSSAGVLIDNGAAGTPTYQLKIKSSTVQANKDGGTLGSVPLPDVGISAATFVAAWVTEPNPATTGSSDAQRSELTVYNASTGTVSRAVFVHELITVAATNTLSIGGVWDGAIFSGDYTDPINIVRISCRYHTSIETREDFVLQTSSPSVDGMVLAELQRMPEAALEVAGVMGHQYQSAAPAATQHRPRLASPLVQARPREWVYAEADLEDVWLDKWIANLGEGWQATLAWLWRCEVQKSCGWVVARVSVALWATDMNPPSQLELRLMASNVPPGVEDEEAVVTYVELTRTTDDGFDGVGELLEFDKLFVVRDQANKTWLWLAARLVGANASTRYAIREITIAPLSVESADLPADQEDIYNP